MAKKMHWALKHCKDRVEDRSQWGPSARDHLGPKLYEMALNAELLLLAASQDEEIDPATIMKVVHEGRVAIIEHIYEEG